jgi:hypothetical protein
MARTDSRIELKKSSRYPGNDVQLPSKLSPDCKSPGSACLIAILQTLKIDKIVSFWKWTSTTQTIHLPRSRKTPSQAKATDQLPAPALLTQVPAMLMTRRT